MLEFFKEAVKEKIFDIEREMKYYEWALKDLKGKQKEYYEESLEDLKEELEKFQDWLNKANKTAISNLEFEIKLGESIGEKGRWNA